MHRWGLGEKQIVGAIVGEGGMVSEKGERQRSIQRNTQGEYFPLAIGLGNEKG